MQTASYEQGRVCTWRSANKSVTSLDILYRLDHEDFVRSDIPVICYLCILCIVGVLGNTSILALYIRRDNSSNHHICILVLAAVDFVACAVVLPCQMYDVYKSYSYINSPLCTSARFLTHLTASGSGFMLTLIAFERYRKICTPHGRQFVGQEIKAACAFVLGLSFVFSLPTIIYYGSTIQDQIPGHKNMTGYHCSMLTSYKHAVVYMAAVLAVPTVLFFLGTVLYIQVGRALFIHYSKLKTRVKTEENQETTLSALQTCNSIISVASVSTPDLKKRAKVKSKHDRAVRITLMLLVATAVSYLSYIPVIVTGIIKVVSPLSVTLGVLPLVHILRHGFFLSNAINPVVYFFMDRDLRKEAKKLYRKVLQWRRVSPIE